MRHIRMILNSRTGKFTRVSLSFLLPLGGFHVTQFQIYRLHIHVDIGPSVLLTACVSLCVRSSDLNGQSPAYSDAHRGGHRHCRFRRHSYTYRDSDSRSNLSALNTNPRALAQADFNTHIASHTNITVASTFPDSTVASHIYAYTDCL
jgi:hypothetical protein